jgi:DNA-binding CsgD family transcriptional regulator
LPADTQLMLLVAAADPEGDPDTLARVGESLGLSTTAIEPAVEDGLLVSYPRVDFRHPLVRSAVYSGATTEGRRRAHFAWADVMDVENNADRRALHLALAATGPNEELATALEQSASQARTRGGYIAESSLLVRSAGLTPDRQRQASRLLAAAHAAFMAGNPGTAESLLNGARPNLVDPLERAHAQRLDGDLRWPLRQPHLAPSLLIEAARAFEPFDRVLSHASLLEAFVAWGISMHFCEGTAGVEIAQTALESLSAQSTAPTAADILLRGVATRYAGSYEEAVPKMREAIRAQVTMPAEEINRWFQLGTALANDLWDDAMLRDIADRREESARAHGSLFALRVALAASMQNDIREGRFAAARERCSELHDIGTAIGGFVDVGDLLDVELLGWQGDEQVRDRTRQLREVGIASLTNSVIHFADLAISVFELGQGHYDAALSAAKSVADADEMGWSCQTLPIVVEAATRCGDSQTAADAVSLIAERATASGTPLARGLLARCQALVANDLSPDELYREALRQFSMTSWLTEIAHSHLLYGEWLRRQRRRSEAREQLREAHKMFDIMGARAFAERARLELLATGERVHSRRVGASQVLTSRELQIARLAARRATSREIASQLYISPNTVDYHLRKVFQKFGISSRRDLAAKLADEIAQLK